MYIYVFEKYFILDFCLYCIIDVFCVEFLEVLLIFCGFKIVIKCVILFILIFENIEW